MLLVFCVDLGVGIPKPFDVQQSHVVEKFPSLGFVVDALERAIGGEFEEGDRLGTGLVDQAGSGEDSEGLPNPVQVGRKIIGGLELFR